MLRDIAALRGLGVTALDFDFEGTEEAASAEQMRRFRSEVMNRI